MKKMMLLLASIVALTACSQSKQDTKESTSTQTAKETKVSESSKKEKELKFGWPLNMKERRPILLS